MASTSTSAGPSGPSGSSRSSTSRGRGNQTAVALETAVEDDILVQQFEARLPEAQRILQTQHLQIAYRFDAAADEFGRDAHHQALHQPLSKSGGDHRRTAFDQQR